MSNRACCARCKTPYNCGNPACACHLGKGAAPIVTAWVAHRKEPDHDTRFETDHTPTEG